MPTIKYLQHEQPEHSNLPDFYPPEEEKRFPIPPWLRIIIALLLVVGLLYIFGGLRELLLYKRTSPDVRRAPIQSTLNATTITLPLQVFILVSDSPNGSKRTQESTLSIVENAENIWNQADITLEPMLIQEVGTETKDLDAFYSNTPKFITTLPNYDADKINVILIGKLGGINGLAYRSLNTAIVADITSVPDFRALAHEIGHILSLGHVPQERARLMYQGANGTHLTTEEIVQAREIAKTFVIQ